MASCRKLEGRERDGEREREKKEREREKHIGTDRGRGNIVDLLVLTSIDLLLFR